MAAGNPGKISYNLILFLLECSQLILNKKITVHIWLPKVRQNLMLICGRGRATDITGVCTLAVFSNKIATWQVPQRYYTLHIVEYFEFLHLCRQ